MNEFVYAHRAAQHFASEFDDQARLDKLGILGYTDLLVLGEHKVVPVHDDRGYQVAWKLHADYVTDDRWYLYDSDGSQVDGPFSTKKRTLKSVGEDSSTKIDTGIYSAGRYYVARKNRFSEWNRN